MVSPLVVLNNTFIDQLKIFENPKTCETLFENIITINSMKESIG